MLNVVFQCSLLRRQAVLGTGLGQTGRSIGRRRGSKLCLNDSSSLLCERRGIGKERSGRIITTCPIARSTAGHRQPRCTPLRRTHRPQSLIQISAVLDEIADKSPIDGSGSIGVP